MRYWQDIRSGERFATTGLTVSEADILEFAAEFDPQPYHLDRGAAQESIFGGLCASGWQVSAMMMRLLTDTLQQQQIAAMGSSGVKQLRWKKPVFAGDVLSADVVIIQLLESGQPGFGVIECLVEVSNQDNKLVITTTISLLVQQREAALRADEV
jgi:acyl dehydratase